MARRRGGATVRGTTCNGVKRNQGSGTARMLPPREADAGRRRRRAAAQRQNRGGAEVVDVSPPRRFPACRGRGRRLRARRSPGARSGAAVQLWGHGGAAGRLVHGGAELGSGAEDSAAQVGFEGGAADGIPGRGRGLRSNRSGSDPRCAGRWKSQHARSRATDSRADPKSVRAPGVRVASARSGGGRSCGGSLDRAARAGRSTGQRASVAEAKQRSMREDCGRRKGKELTGGSGWSEGERA